MTDDDAVAISENIQKYHLPHGFIAETIFKGDGTVGGIDGHGDCAIWTGVYLAAEAFRFAVTEDARALTYLKQALTSVQTLAYVAPSGFLARAMFPDDSPYREKLMEAEKHSGLFKVIHNEEKWFWIGHHTRDQYAGALFGLGTAHDLVKDADVKKTCRDTTSRKRYLNYYATLREKTDGHFNAHFNMIDCALNGLHDDRDKQTVELLEALLVRKFRNCPVDGSKKYRQCGDDACLPVPVRDRPYEDFLWQRHPFSMVGGGDGSKESPGLDFLLPYWMARYYKVIEP